MKYHNNHCLNNDLITFFKFKMIKLLIKSRISKIEIKIREF